MNNMSKKLNALTMLFKPATFRLAHFLLSDPMKEVYVREAARAGGVSLGSAAKILRSLSEFSIVELREQGRMHFYRVNMESAVTRQFKILLNILAMDGLVKRLKEHCRKVIIFGSSAEGTNVVESDIDIFVLTSDPEKVRREINRYERSVEKGISAIVLTPSEFSQLRTRDKPLYDSVVKGMTLWQVQ